MIAFDRNYDDSTLDPDAERMVRVAAGDRAAFDELVRRNFASTVRIISAMMGSSCQSEDLAQDVFLRVYRSRQRYLPTAKFSTWLGTIARNVVLNAKRSRSRSRVYSSLYGDDWSPESTAMITPAVEYNLAEKMEQQEMVTVVTRAIGQLPRRQRMAIELVHFRGLTYAGAAAEMETTQKAIKSLLGRGRAALEQTLKGKYYRRFEASR